jgi:SAM-dependent methyltransferase
MTDEPLTPQNLRRDFGACAAVTREGVRVLREALAEVSPAVLAGWRVLFGKWAGRALEKVPRHLAKLSSRYGIAPSPAGSDTLLFALQTYYALLVGVVAGRFFGSNGHDLLPDNPFSWCSPAPSAAVCRLVDRLVDAVACRPIAASAADGDCDWFKPLYEDLFPRALRHQLGEYYTPDWLADHVLDQVGYTGEAGTRLLDPACGSGTFLLLALRRWRGEGRRRNVTPPCPLLSPLSPIVGFDLNPLAVMTARANYLIAIADLLPTAGRVEVPIYLCDSILGTGAAKTCGAEFDYVVGNPPWIAWDNLPDEDRQATKPLWERYGLFSLSGREARHGGGKKDLSMLMLYAAADRYLKPGGRLGMVITQTLFQTGGAGDGFRRLQLGADGPPLGVLRVDDMVALRPFGDAANWTSTIVLQKGVATEYPVPYYVWDEGRGTRTSGRSCSPSPLSSLPSPLAPRWARPIDPAKPNSPWLIVSEKNGPSSAITSGVADYVAHLGANSGGANGVYWMEILEVVEDGVRIRNSAARGKHEIDSAEHLIEPDLLYPLLRWSDVRRWRAASRDHILLAQDPATRTGIGEDLMRTRYPRTWAYLEQFRGLLVSRAAYRRYQQRGSFYSMYNIGPYTMAPVKVVWRRMDRRINAAVVEEFHDPLLGRRPMIPQETCVLVACDSADEAHYLAALLNSAIVNELVRASSVCGGKGFGTPGMLAFLPLRRFQPANRQHGELAALSRQAHATAEEDVHADIQGEIDRLAAAILS